MPSLTLGAVLDQIITGTYSLTRAIEFKKFLITIDKNLPDEINAWLARHPRFHIHFTPTGSSRVNQVERWFGLITEKLIRRGIHPTVVDLEDDTRAWIDTWNANPRPFTWTKTADDILNSHAKYLSRISGAGH